MPSNSSYRINNKGFNDIANGPEVKAALLAIAEKAKAKAEALSAEFADTGNYSRSFEIREESVSDVGRSSRAAAILENTASYAAHVEAGHQDEQGREIRGHHVLQRTLESLENDD